MNKMFLVLLVFAFAGCARFQSFVEEKNPYLEIRTNDAVVSCFGLDLNNIPLEICHIKNEESPNQLCVRASFIKRCWDI
jgi:hypothetical protein